MTIRTWTTWTTWTLIQALKGMGRIWAESYATYLGLREAWDSTLAQGYLLDLFFL